ncbi:anti-sigma-K factor RskA [Actinoplanes abujensis]|uniref:Anti-sigma-K factor RskA n=1 Tax=Paractinoplanes abujensis TaxID=882441 RepID=A0A7W7CUA9_9ACTN|nr:anti-sigma-K factor RskA [Actinoplanes abujensis]
MDPDRLVLLALSEEIEELSESDHLAQCEGCRREIEELRHVAELGSQAQDLRELPDPPAHVWHAIQAGIADAPAPVAPVIDMAGRRERRQRPRWVLPTIAAAAAAVLAVAGTVAVDRFTNRTPDGPVTARATLEPLKAAPPNAGGDVRVLDDGRMRVDVRNLPLTTGFHEVWLLDPDQPGKMVAVGSLSDKPDAVLPVPPGTDLNRYRLVDISDEPHDGDATHSGRSLLRGTLTY